MRCFYLDSCHKLVFYLGGEGKNGALATSLKKGLEKEIEVYDPLSKTDVGGKKASLKYEDWLKTEKGLPKNYSQIELDNFLINNSRLFMKKNGVYSIGECLYFQDSINIDVLIGPSIYKMLKHDKNVFLPFNKIFIQLALDKYF